MKEYVIVHLLLFCKEVTVSECQGVLFRTGKLLKRTFSTYARNHILEYDCEVAKKDFKILGRGKL